MGLRPGRCYRSKKDRAYTRLAVTVHDKNYIGAAPGLRVGQFNMGNPTKEFTHIVDLVVDEDVQLRDNSLESARMTANKVLESNLGPTGYFFRIRVYPFHILRENPLAQGAGADRFSTGMAHSFGKTMGNAAQVERGQIIIEVGIDKEHIELAKKALTRAKTKLPCSCIIEIKENKITALAE